MSEYQFPPVEKASSDGLLASGGDLSPQCLMTAYRNGIFPWYTDGQPLLWWSPDPRCVLYPSAMKVSRSLRKNVRHGGFEVTMDYAFLDVIDACSKPRGPGEDKGTWITDDMIEAYVQLHTLGHAHSVEVWHEESLAGGLYGVAVGKVFCGESMFSRQSNASKIALLALCRQLEQWKFKLIDCQMPSAHLASLGAGSVSRQDFCRMLARYRDPHALNRQPSWRRSIDRRLLV